MPLPDVVLSGRKPCPRPGAAAWVPEDGPAIPAALVQAAVWPVPHRVGRAGLQGLSAGSGPGSPARGPGPAGRALVSGSSPLRSLTKCQCSRGEGGCAGPGAAHAASVSTGFCKVARAAVCPAALSSLLAGAQQCREQLHAEVYSEDMVFSSGLVRPRAPRPAVGHRDRSPAAEGGWGAGRGPPPVGEGCWPSGPSPVGHLVGLPAGWGRVFFGSTMWARHGRRPGVRGALRGAGRKSGLRCRPALAAGRVQPCGVAPPLLWPGASTSPQTSSDRGRSGWDRARQAQRARAARGKGRPHRRSAMSCGPWRPTCGPCPPCSAAPRPGAAGPPAACPAGLSVAGTASCSCSLTSRPSRPLQARCGRGPLDLLLGGGGHRHVALPRLAARSRLWAAAPGGRPLHGLRASALQDTESRVAL